MSSFSSKSIQKLNVGEAMGVILKQRTCEDKNGKAVPDGNKDSRYLVGPKGASVTDKKALSLGLVDGHLPDYEQMEEDRLANEERRDKDAAEKKEAQKPEDKSMKPSQNKEADKAGKKEPNPLSLEERIKDCMETMATEAIGNSEAEERLFTVKGSPDTYVLSTRLEANITASVRDKLWAEVLEKDPALADRS